MSDDFDLGYRWGLFVSELDCDDRIDAAARVAALKAVVEALPNWPKTTRSLVAQALTDGYSAYMTHGYGGDA